MKFLKLFNEGVLQGRIFVPNREEVTEPWPEPYNQPHDLYFSCKYYLGDQMKDDNMIKSHVSIRGRSEK
jgi:hypothetical protein